MSCRQPLHVSAVQGNTEEWKQIYQKVLLLSTAGIDAVMRHKYGDIGLPMAGQTGHTMQGVGDVC